MSALLHAVASVLVVAGAALVFVCAVGVYAMRDAYQRLHYLTPPGTIAAGLVALAVWLVDRQWQAGALATLAWLVLTVGGAAMAHATARAARVREVGRLGLSEPERGAGR